MFHDSDDGRRRQQSTVYKWQNAQFVLYQSLYTEAAQAWEHFSINGHVSIYTEDGTFINEDDNSIACL